VETCGPTDCTTGATSTGEFDTSVRRAQGLLDAKKNTGHGEQITITFGASFILYSKNSNKRKTQASGHSKQTQQTQNNIESCKEVS